jgi:hypothetical protein
MWPQGLGLSQHSLHGGAADLHAGAKHLPRYGAGAELRLRAQPPEFMHSPANRLVDPVPGHGSIQETRPASAFGSLDPGTDRVAMQDEVFRGLSDAPSSQSPELQDSQPLLGSVVWPPMRR